MLNQKTGLEGQGYEQNWPGTACLTSGCLFQLSVSHIPHLPNTLRTCLQTTEKSLRKCIVCHSAEYAYHWETCVKGLIVHFLCTKPNPCSWKCRVSSLQRKDAFNTAKAFTKEMLCTVVQLLRKQDWKSFIWWIMKFIFL